MPVQKEALFRGFRVALGKQHLARLLVPDAQPVLLQGGDRLVHVGLHEEVGRVARLRGQIEPRPLVAALVDVVEVGHDRARGIVPPASPLPVAERQLDGRLAAQGVEDVPRLLAREGRRRLERIEFRPRQGMLVHERAQAAEHRVLQQRHHLPHRRIRHRFRLHPHRPPSDRPSRAPPPQLEPACTAIHVLADIDSSSYAAPRARGNPPPFPASTLPTWGFRDGFHLVRRETRLFQLSIF